MLSTRPIATVPKISATNPERCRARGVSCASILPSAIAPRGASNVGKSRARAARSGTLVAWSGRKRHAKPAWSRSLSSLENASAAVVLRSKLASASAASAPSAERERDQSPRSAVIRLRAASRVARRSSPDGAGRRQGRRRTATMPHTIVSLGHAARSTTTDHARRRRENLNTEKRGCRPYARPIASEVARDASDSMACRAPCNLPR